MAVTVAKTAKVNAKGPPWLSFSIVVKGVSSSFFFSPTESFGSNKRESWVEQSQMPPCPVWLGSWVSLEAGCGMTGRAVSTGLK